jgi:RimJ/RimL family protein N-acetyltransferase/ribosomal protein S18 acetylase RimI-like enzyme
VERPVVPEIETARLRLRGHRLADFEACASLWADPLVTRYIGGAPLSTEDAWSKFLRYSGHWSQRGFGFWAVEEKSTGRYIGELGFADFKRDMLPPLEDVPEAGWVLASSAHGKGYATEALRAAHNWLKAPRTVCLIHPENLASIRVAEKSGYKMTRPAFYKGVPVVIFTRAEAVSFEIRLATEADIVPLRALIDLSVRTLQKHDYSPEQIEGALTHVFGTDRQLVADGTYFVAEAVLANGERSLAGCGGWSKRKTLYGSDVAAGRDDNLLDPASEAAKIRAFFVHPAWSRRGLGSMILEACENAARAAGFRSFEMGATLTGVKLFQARGYSPIETIAVPLGEGPELPVVRMGKRIPDHE